MTLMSCSRRSYEPTNTSVKNRDSYTQLARCKVSFDHFSRMQLEFRKFLLERIIFLINMCKGTVTCRVYSYSKELYD
jgi:hypothetical protein